jgi:hypothetical protein
VVTSLPIEKPIAKIGKANFLRQQAIQEPIFSVAYADFEGGGDGQPHWWLRSIHA